MGRYKLCLDAKILIGMDLGAGAAYCVAMKEERHGEKMKMPKNRESSMKTVMAAILCCVVATVCFVMPANAQDPVDLLDTWNDGTTGAWFAAESKVILSNPGDYLNMQFQSQNISRSQSDTIRKNIGLGVVVTNISLKFQAPSILPSEVRVCFHSVRSGYLWFVSAVPTNAGEWMNFDIPLNRDMAWVVGPDGCVQQFEGDVGFVDWVGVHVRRHGSVKVQNYCMDDFRVTGYSMGDVDGDGIPDFWETVYNVNTNDPRHASYDIDGDGLNMYQEFRAGTDPADPTSSLEMSIDGTNDVSSVNGVVVKWRSIGGHYYSLYKSTNLMQGFSLFTSNMVATPPVNSYQDTTATNSGPYFYRVGVE